MNSFGQLRPVRDKAGIKVGHLPSEVKRRTRKVLDGSFGCDRGRRLVVKLQDGDVIAVRPERSQRAWLAITAHDLYATLIRWSSNKAQLEKARQKKDQKKEQRARRQIADADRRMRKAARAERE